MTSDHKYDIPGSNAAMRMHLDEAHGIPWDDTENDDYARNITLHVELHKPDDRMAHKEDDAFQPGDRARMTDLRDATTRDVTVETVEGAKAVVRDDEGGRYRVGVGFLTKHA